MQFKDTDIQVDIANRLTNLIDQGRISHAQMVLGTPQSGTFALTWAYIQYLFCTNRQHYDHGELHADSCGECPQCKKIASLSHPDVHLFFPTNTNSEVKKDPQSSDFVPAFSEFMIRTKGRGDVDDWYMALGIEKKKGVINVRDADTMTSQLAMRSYEGGWKVAVVWMADKMNVEFANKILKTLEEPTPQTLLVLVVENDEVLLPTIKSRVQTIRLLDTNNGGDKALDEQFGELAVQWLRQLFKLDMKQLSDHIDKLSTMNRDMLQQYLRYCHNIMHESFLRNVAHLPSSLHTGDQRFDDAFPNMITEKNIETIDKLFNDAIFAIDRNAYVKLALMHLSFRLSLALKKK